MNHPIPPNAPNNVVNLRFPEGEGISTIDSTGNTTASLVNGPVWVSGYPFPPCSYTISITPNGTTFCSGSNVVLSASAADEYHWQDGSTSSSLSFNAQQSGTFSVVGKSGQCYAYNE